MCAPPWELYRAVVGSPGMTRIAAKISIELTRSIRRLKPSLRMTKRVKRWRPSRVADRNRPLKAALWSCCLRSDEVPAAEALQPAPQATSSRRGFVDPWLIVRRLEVRETGRVDPDHFQSRTFHDRRRVVRE